MQTLKIGGFFVFVIIAYVIIINNNIVIIDIFKNFTHLSHMCGGDVTINGI